MSPIQGFVRARKHLFGRQSVFGTKVPATRAYPFRGVPTNNLNWTDPEVDAGTIYPIASPFRGVPDLSGPLTDPALKYNNIPLIMAGFFGGAITPTGGGDAKTWAWDPAASPPLDDFDPFTYQFGDDVTTDWFQYGDCYLQRFEITGPVGLAALSTSLTWRLGSISSTGSTDSPVTGTVPTPGLSVATEDAVVYLKDASLFIADDPYDIDAGQVTDALHSFVLRGTQTTDEKRFANGTQNFDLSGLGRGGVNIELEATYAKTSDTVGTGSESDAWLSDLPVNRFIKLAFESTVEAESAVPYSWEFFMPARYYTRTEGNIGGNTTVVLNAHAFVEPDDFGGVFRTNVVNTLASL